MEENIFDKIKNTISRQQTKPAEPIKQVTKISDIKLTDDSKHKIFTLNDEIKK